MISKMIRHRKHVFPDWHPREDVVHTERSGIGYAPTQAAGTEATALAGKGHNATVPAVAAQHTNKPVSVDILRLLSFAADHLVKQVVLKSASS
jgi:hypothetical protein